MVDVQDPGDLLARRYRLVQRLGGGSTGVVYRSFDDELEDWVAVKLLRARLTKPASAQANLRRAIKLARRVTHRNVARVFEFGRDGDQQFLTAEYIAGDSLEARLAQLGRLAPEQIPGLALDLCKALAAAHAVDVVHGDVKPSNILFAPGRGVVLTDFGLRRSLDGDSVRYIAPELSIGAAPSPHDDIHSFGCVLLEALTGITIPAGRLHRTADQLRALAPALSGDWLELLTLCMQPRPERRPDAQALLSRLIGMYRGTGHVAMSGDDDGEALSPPLGASASARWLTVHPFTTVDDGLRGDCGWIAADLVQALRHVRSLRVVSDGQGPQQGPHLTVRGELQAADDGLRVTVRITAADAEPPLTFVLAQPRGLLPSLGVELAARVLGTLGVAGRSRPALPPELVAGETVDHFIQARTAIVEMRTAAAVQHYTAALALAPRHRALRLGYVRARVRHAIVFRSLTPADVSELRALVEAALAEHSDGGDGGDSSEAYLAMASLMYSLDEPVECMRWARAAANHAPTVDVLVLVANILVVIGRLQDGARRLDIAAALEQRSAQLWLCRAMLVAFQGRWDEFYAIFNGPIIELGMANVYTAHLMLWRTDPATLERLAAMTAADQASPAANRDLRALVDFLLERRDRRQILEELAAVHAGGPRSFHRRRMHMLMCEMACILGDLPRAHALLARANEHSLIEWQWLTHSPNLAALRDDPRYLDVRAAVRERADAVAEVLWG